MPSFCVKPPKRLTVNLFLQAMLGTCRCLLVHRYTSSQTSLDEDRLFRVEASEYNQFNKPRSDNDIFTSYTNSPRSRVPRIFQQFPLRQQKAAKMESKEISDKLSEGQYFPVKNPEVQKEPQLESPTVQTKEEVSINN